MAEGPGVKNLPTRGSPFFLLEPSTLKRIGSQASNVNHVHRIPSRLRRDYVLERKQALFVIGGIVVFCCSRGGLNRVD
jgi:hypothetical protein